jgi:PAS domain S-box-containing protein
MVSPQGKILDINVSALSALGYEKKEIIGTPVLTTIYAPSSLEKAKNLFARWKKIGVLKNEELAIITKKGSERTVLLSVHAVRNSQGDLLHSISVQRDITRQKQMEQSLRESEERYRELFQKSPISITLLDQKGRIIDCNRATERLIGYSKEEIMRTPFEHLTTLEPEDLPALKKIFSTLLQGKDVPPYELQIIRKDGKKRYIRVINSIIKKESTSLGFQIISTDITDQKLADENLKENEEKYRSLFHNSRDAIFIHDQEGTIIDVNQKVLDLFGYSKQEILSLSIQQLHPPYALEISSAAFDEISNNTSVSFEIDFWKKNGEIFPAEVSSSLFEVGGKEVIQGIVRDITERKKVEKALNRSEEKFRTLTENVNVGVYRNTPGSQGKFIEANPAIITMFGYETKEEFLDLEVSQLYQNPTDRKAFNEKMLTEGFVKNEELLLKRKDRTLFIGSVSAVAVKDEKGQILHFDGIIEDITERKEIERELQESEEKYRTILESIEDGYFEVDITGNFTFVNDSLCSILGYSSDELIGMNNREYMDEKTAKLVFETFNNIFKTKKSKKAFDWEIIRKDTSKRFIEASISLITDMSDEPIGFRGIVRDITERREVEEKLRYSEEKYRTLVEHTLQGIVIVQDYPPRIVFANPGLAEISGYSVQELQSFSPENAHILIHPDDRDLFFSRYRARLKGESPPSTYEFRIICKGGEIRWLELYSTRIIYQGEPAVQAVFMDITKRKEAEQMLKKFNLDLERRIQERSVRIEALLNARQNLQKEQDWEEGLMTIVESMDKLGFERIGIFLVNAPRKNLVFHLGKGITFPDIGSFISLAEKDYYGVRCVLEKKTVFLENASVEKGKQITPEAQSVAWVPIIVSDEAFAALSVGAVTNERPITEEDVKDLEILAGMCGSFIDRTRIIIEPIAEKSLVTEVRQWLEPSRGYIIREKKPNKSFDIFCDLVTHGIPGFIISRQHPERVRRKYRLLKTPIIWLSRSKIKETLSPDDLHKLNYIMDNFTKSCEESVILLDGVEYLITQSDFKSVVKFIQGLKDLVVLNNSRLIIPLYESTLTTIEYSIFEREFTIL